MDKPFVISADYIIWAHEPGAEDQQPLATELCALAEKPNKRGQAEIPANRLDLIHEIADVAELYVGGRDTDLRAARAMARARAVLKAANYGGRHG